LLTVALVGTQELHMHRIDFGKLAVSMNSILWVCRALHTHFLLHATAFSAFPLLHVGLGHIGLGDYAHSSS